MMLKWRLIILFITVSVCGGGSVCAQGFDARWLSRINPDDPASRYWKQTSNTVYYTAAALPAGTLLYGLITDDDKIKHNGIELFISLGANALMTDVFKRSFNRMRPSNKYPDMIFPDSSPAGYSFPSGHTSLAFATATTLSLQYKKWYVAVPVYAWATSVSYSRMYLGKHYPSDVFAGAIVGVGSGLATHWLNKKLFKSYYKKPIYDQ